MKNANESKPFCYYVTNAEGDVEYNGIPQMSDGRIGAPLYTEPPASSQLLATVKEVIAAEEEARMGAPEMVAHEVKRDVVSRRLNAWGALHAAVGREEAGAGEWLPIDSAPGNEILLLATEFDGSGDWRIKCGYRDDENNRGWKVWGASWKPTRWMKMPAAPAGSGRQQEQRLTGMAPEFGRSVEEEVLRANGLLPAAGCRAEG